MYFKKIEMHGFKSFAEPVTIDFSSGITCIVGPNGSGKSNISDAIRWVLGEQSPKMLRGGKMEEVIFSGTSSRKSRGMAEVTLVIDNAEGTLPIDYKEVALTRRMFRSGESEYHINGNQCRLRDIRELIMDTGIGVDGYSIIGQGKISEILSNKTESRREIFEEAAGIVLYRTKKAESERKLEAAIANCHVDGVTAKAELLYFPLTTYTGVEGRGYQGENPFVASADADYIQKVKAAIEDAVGREIQTKPWAFATDTGHYAAKGVKCLGYSPAEIKLCHTTRDSIDIAMMEEGTVGYLAAVQTLANEPK